MNTTSCSSPSSRSSPPSSTTKVVSPIIVPTSTSAIMPPTTTLPPLPTSLSSGPLAVTTTGTSTTSTSSSPTTSLPPFNLSDGLNGANGGPDGLPGSMGPFGPFSPEMAAEMISRVNGMQGWPYNPAALPPGTGGPLGAGVPPGWPFNPTGAPPPPDMGPWTLPFYPYDGFYPNTCASMYGMDLNGARRKNATRETTSTLKAWLSDHRKNPYPTKGEKIMLAIITKMTLTQVSTWFANARRRLKKENKMTWSPRNRCDDDDDDDDDRDDDGRQTDNGGNNTDGGNDTDGDRDDRSDVRSLSGHRSPGSSPLLHTSSRVPSSHNHHHHHHHGRSIKESDEGAEILDIEGDDDDDDIVSRHHHEKDGKGMNGETCLNPMCPCRANPLVHRLTNGSSNNNSKFNLGHHLPLNLHSLGPLGHLSSLPHPGLGPLTSIPGTSPPTSQPNSQLPPNSSSLPPPPSTHPLMYCSSPFPSPLSAGHHPSLALATGGGGGGHHNHLLNQRNQVKRSVWRVWEK